MILLAVLFGLLSLSICPGAQASSFDFHHTALTKELHKYVENDKVHYKRWQKSPGNLTRYLSSLATISPEELDHLSTEGKTALWLNAYNALTIKAVLERYPIAGKSPYYPPTSFRQIPDCWDAFAINIAGRTFTLDQIEHDTLRQMHDPRTHFMVVCAGNGCAHIRPNAFQADTLQQDMVECTNKFLGDPKNIEIDPTSKTIKVTQLFKWFPLDFAKAAGLAKKFPPPTDDEIVLAYLAKNLPDKVVSGLPSRDDLLNYHIIYTPSDWTLNDADAAPMPAAVH
jgi:hypothetical protein